MKNQIGRLLAGGATCALATNGPHGLNVVPVSVVEVKDDEIHLYDFFMRKTAENIQSESVVALTCWSGFSGFQIKAEARYDTTVEVYEQAVLAMKERFPERTLRAVIRLRPNAIYDIAPASNGDNLLISF